jgi:hypothetical protein
MPTGWRVLVLGSRPPHRAFRYYRRIAMVRGAVDEHNVGHSRDGSGYTMLDTRATAAATQCWTLAQRQRRQQLQ